MGKTQSKFLISSFSLVLMIIGILNTRLELFELDGILGVLFYGVSLFFLPAHICAMVVTNAADPPDLWGVIVCYSVQAFFVILIGKHIFIKKTPKVEKAIDHKQD